MSECYCDYEPPEFCIVTRPKARKPHRCHECSGFVRVGEVYEHVRGKWDGDIVVYKACPDCIELRAWAEAHVPCLCLAMGQMHQGIIDGLGDHDEPGLGLVQEADAKMKEIRRRRAECSPPA